MNEDQKELITRLKEMIIRRCRPTLTPDDIGDSQPLFGSEEGSFGLDSVEALEIAVAIEDEFEVRVDEGEEAVANFYSVEKLAAYIAELRERGD